MATGHAVATHQLAAAIWCHGVEICRVTYVRHCVGMLPTRHHKLPAHSVFRCPLAENLTPPNPTVNHGDQTKGH